MNDWKWGDCRLSVTSFGSSERAPTEEHSCA